MSGWFGSTTKAQTEPVLGDLKVQTSVYGLTIPLGYGRYRVAGNLLDYDDFKSVRREEYGEGGKGGDSPTRTTYVYSASVMMAIGEGPITQVRRVWIGKEKHEAVPADSRERSAEHTAEVIPGSPIAVTFASTFMRLGAVVIPTTDYAEGHDVSLSEGIDFTRSGGTFTFNGPWFKDEFDQPKNRTVKITYVYQSVTDAMTALGALGLNLRSGSVDQNVWQHWATNHVNKAIPYSGIAYIFGRDYALDSSAAVPNHNFEVDGQLQFSATIPDAVPAAVIRDIFTSTIYGVSFPSAYLETFQRYADYCIASGLFVSPVYTSQRPARDVAGELLEATNAIAGWTGDKLRIIPRGDKTVSANGVTYLAPNTIVAELGVDDFVGGTVNPVQVERIDATDAHNRVTVEYSNRDQDYRSEPVVVEDEAAIAQYGLRSEASQSWPFFCIPAAANQAARLRLQRKQAVWAKYRFGLTQRYAGVEIGDIFSITEPSAYLDHVTVMVLAITEDSNDVIWLEVEHFPIGIHSAPLLAPELGSGFKPQYNADPGVIVAPVFVEMPTDTGLELRIAVTGLANSPLWGGCEIFASMDGGVDFKLVGRAKQGARYGTVTAALGTGANAQLDVTLAGKGGQLFSTSAYEADALATLCFVGESATGEWLAFETATLIGLNQYRLTGLKRGRFGTKDQAAIVGTKFVFIDGSLAVADSMPLALVGKEVRFKFASYNVFGNALQSLAVAPEHAHVMSGRFIGTTAAPIGANLLSNSSMTYGIAGLVVSKNGLTGAVDVFKGNAGQWLGGVKEGSPSNAILWQDNASTGGNPYVGWPTVSVIAGQRYVGAALLLPERCDGWLAILWINAAGEWFATSGRAIEYERINDLSGVSSLDLRFEQNYRLAWLFGIAPATAVSARFVVVKSPTVAGQGNSALTFCKPMLSLARAEQITPPIWSPGGQNSVGTGLIEQDAATAIYRPLTPIAEFNLFDPPRGTAQIFRFTPSADGKLNIDYSAEVASQGLDGSYNLEGGIQVSGAEVSKQNVLGLYSVVSVVYTVPSGDVISGSMVRTVTLDVKADNEVIVYLSLERVGKGLQRVAKTIQGGRDIVRNQSLTATLIKR